MTLLETDTRLRVARALQKHEAEGSLEVMRLLKRRAHPHAPPPIVSDGGSGCADAMIEVWGEIPAYKGTGRYPKYKQALPGWQHLRLVKLRDERTRVVGLELRVVFGEQERVTKELGQGTVHIERTHLTMRQSNGRLVRKTLAFSKKLTMLRYSAAWEDLVYNVAKPLKTLRKTATDDPTRKWIPQTPAMAAGLCDHCWSFKELLYKVPIFKHQHPSG